MNMVRKKAAGFTLIELMIALVIVAILAAVAYPAYQSHVRKSRRADAMSTLTETVQALERCYTEFNAYNDTNCPVVDAGPTVDLNSNNGFYDLSSLDGGGNETLAANSFTLRATPTNRYDQDKDTQCAEFTVAQTGARAAEDDSGNDTTDLCWSQ